MKPIKLGEFCIHKVTSEEELRAYYAGKLDSLVAYSVWKGGEQFVGMDRPLMDEVDRVTKQRDKDLKLAVKQPLIGKKRSRIQRC